MIKTTVQTQNGLKKFKDVDSIAKFVLLDDYNNYLCSFDEKGETLNILVNGLAITIEQGADGTVEVDFNK